MPDLAGDDVWSFVSRDGAHSLTQIAIPQKENNEPHITPDNPDPNLPYRGTFLDTRLFYFQELLFTTRFE